MTLHLYTAKQVQNISHLIYYWHIDSNKHNTLILTEPVPVQIYGHKWGRDGEVVHKGEQLYPEHQLVVRSYKLQANKYRITEWVSEWVNWLFNVTTKDISVIYVTAHRCAGGLKKKLDLRSGSQRHRHFVGFFNVPVLAPTRDQPFYTVIPTHRPI